MLFKFGIGLFVLFSLIELYPKRFKGIVKFAPLDRISGSLIVGVSALHALVCIIDHLIFSEGTSWASWIIGFADTLILLGISIRYIARHKLGNDFSASVAPIKSGTLTSTGIYKYIRHPAYLGTLIYSLGLFLLFSSMLGILTFLLLLLCFIYRIRVEESYLLNKYTGDYTQYMANTKKLIPFIF